jgi:uncharacterized protein with HEPN domain
MAERARQRLADILDAISQIELLAAGKQQTDLETDRFFRDAFERFVEIVSEASRRMPYAVKSKHPDIPWPRIAAIGNYLRHAYHRVDSGVLWSLLENGDLGKLKTNVEEAIADNGKA